VTEVDIHCIPQFGADAAAVAVELETYLQRADDVVPVLIEVEQPRLGLAEVLAILEVTSTGVDLTEKLIYFISSRRGRGKVKDIEIEIDGQRVSVGSLTPDQRTRLAAAIAQGT